MRSTGVLGAIPNPIGYRPGAAKRFLSAAVQAMKNPCQSKRVSRGLWETFLPQSGDSQAADGTVRDAKRPANASQGVSRSLQAGDISRMGADGLGTPENTSLSLYAGKTSPCTFGSLYAFLLR